MGEVCCKKLGLNFDKVYANTNTSYKPIQIVTTNGNEWFSDYKSASSVERVEAFLKLGRPDPVLYADETGRVEWNVVKEHVEKVLADA